MKARPADRNLRRGWSAAGLQQLRDALEGLGWLPLVLFGVRQIFLDAAVDPSTFAIGAQRHARLVEVEHGFPPPVGRGEWNRWHPVTLQREIGAIVAQQPQ